MRGGWLGAGPRRPSLRLFEWEYERVVGLDVELGWVGWRGWVATNGVVREGELLVTSLGSICCNMTMIDAISFSLSRIRQWNSRRFVAVLSVGLARPGSAIGDRPTDAHDKANQPRAPGLPVFGTNYDTAQPRAGSAAGILCAKCWDMYLHHRHLSATAHPRQSRANSGHKLSRSKGTIAS